MAKLGDLQGNQMGKDVGKFRVNIWTSQICFPLCFGSVRKELVLGYHNYLLELFMYLPKN